MPDTFSFPRDSRFRITEKYNLRKRINGKYAGYVYREIRGNLLEGSSGTYEGRFYIFEETTENTQTAHRVEQTVTAAFAIRDNGQFVLEHDQGYPRLRSFPLFPATDLSIGDSWRDFGEVIVDPRRDGNTTAVRFYCEYIYKGPIEYNGEPGYSFSARYALRYSAGDDPGGDSNLSRISGKHVVSIFLGKSGAMFLRDQMEDLFTYRNGEKISYKGFTLTWYGSFKPLDRDLVEKELLKELQDSGVEDVTVEKREEGVSLTLQNIRFQPDKAVFLPGEEGRIAAVATALQKIPDRSILVVGHTADIGTYESQYILSIERAKAVVDILSAQGIPAKRFLFEGRAGMEPVASNDTEEGRAQNRRVEIFILED